MYLRSLLHQTARGVLTDEHGRFQHSTSRATLPTFLHDELFVLRAELRAVDVHQRRLTHHPEL